jgi:hypothetical protein
MSNKHNQEWEDRLVHSGCLVYEDSNGGQLGFTIIIPTVNCEEELEKIFELILDWHQDSTDQMQGYRFGGKQS